MNRLKLLFFSLVLSLAFIPTTFVSAQDIPGIDVVSPIPVGDEALRRKETGISIFGVDTGVSWDGLAYAAAQEILSELIEETTEWVNSGFDGNPAYATDPEQYLTNIADNVAGQFIEGSELSFLCSPFQTQVRLALLQSYAQRSQYQCTLTSVVSNIEAFYSDFGQGGWDAWFVMTQNNANNPYGSYIDAKIDLDRRVMAALRIEEKQLDWNDGFRQWRDERCISDDPETGECIGGYEEYGPVKTPGSVINDQLNNALGSEVRRLELADEMNELLVALINQLLKKALGEAGLFD